MYDTIILPLDGSRFAELAIPTAADIARRTGADLVLVRVHESYLYEDMDYLLAEDQSRRDQDEYLAQIAERVEAEFSLEAERSLLEGPIVPSICKFTEALQSPLIVISTHGRTGFSRLWLGSVADAIARHASSPVLMLRHDAAAVSAGASPHLVKRVLVPLDGSDLAETALAPATALTQHYGARLTLLRVVTPLVVPAPVYALPLVLPPERFEDTEAARFDAAKNYLVAIAARLRLEDRDLLVETDARIGESVAPTILQGAEARQIDTVVMATHGRGASRLMVPSVADKILRGGPEAVLLVRGASTV